LIARDEARYWLRIAPEFSKPPAVNYVECDAVVTYFTISGDKKLVMRMRGYHSSGASKLCVVRNGYNYAFNLILCCNATETEIQKSAGY